MSHYRLWCWSICVAMAAGRQPFSHPSQAMEALAGIQRTDGGAAAVWSVPVGGRMSTNLAAVSLAGGRLALGVGREDGVLLIWTPG